MVSRSRYDSEPSPVSTVVSTECENTAPPGKGCTSWSLDVHDTTCHPPSTQLAQSRS